MNLPNKLTIFRVILIIPFVFFMKLDALCARAAFMDRAFGGILTYTSWIALGIFIVASLTDLLDGKIARKYNLVTTFGKFMDPLADKLLVCAALVLLVENKNLPSWIAIVILSREFIISGFRSVAAEKGTVIAASYWGKFKTTFQMVMICMMIPDMAAILPGDGVWYYLATQIVMWIALILTVISLIDYLVKNKNVMKDIK